LTSEIGWNAVTNPALHLQSWFDPLSMEIWAEYLSYQPVEFLNTGWCRVLFYYHKRNYVLASAERLETKGIFHACRFTPGLKYCMGRVTIGTQHWHLVAQEARAAEITHAGGSTG